MVLWSYYMTCSLKTRRNVLILNIINALIAVIFQSVYIIFSLKIILTRLLCGKVSDFFCYRHGNIVRYKEWRDNFMPKMFWAFIVSYFLIRFVQFSLKRSNWHIEHVTVTELTIYHRCNNTDNYTVCRGFR